MPRRGEPQFVDGRRYWLLRDPPERRGPESFRGSRFVNPRSSFWSWAPVSVNDSAASWVRASQMKPGDICLCSSPRRPLALTVVANVVRLEDGTVQVALADRITLEGKPPDAMDDVPGFADNVVAAEEHDLICPMDPLDFWEIIFRAHGHDIFKPTSRPVVRVLSPWPPRQPRERIVWLYSANWKSSGSPLPALGLNALAGRHSTGRVGMVSWAEGAAGRVCLASDRVGPIPGEPFLLLANRKWLGDGSGLIGVGKIRACQLASRGDRAPTAQLLSFDLDVERSMEMAKSPLFGATVNRIHDKAHPGLKQKATLWPFEGTSAEMLLHFHSTISAVSPPDVAQIGDPYDDPDGDEQFADDPTVRALLQPHIPGGASENSGLGLSVRRPRGRRHAIRQVCGPIKGGAQASDCTEVAGSGNGWVDLAVPLEGNESDDKIQLPTGLLFLPKSDKYQLGLLVQRVIIEVPAHSTKRVLLRLYCGNEGRRPADEEIEYVPGPVTQDPAVWELLSLLVTKKLAAEAERELVQQAVWDVTDRGGLSDERRASLARLPS